jgi:hypothetical protein
MIFKPNGEGVGPISHLANAKSRRAERGFALAEEEAARQTEPSSLSERTSFSKNSPTHSRFLKRNSKLIPLEAKSIFRVASNRF